MNFIMICSNLYTTKELRGNEVYEFGRNLASQKWAWAKFSNAISQSRLRRWIISKQSIPKDNATNSLAHQTKCSEGGHIGDIISIIERDGFKVKKMKLLRFDENLAAEFYREHIGKSFYDKLVAFMCSGDSVALHLEKEDAIARLRELMGDVEPEKRKPGTIRALYGEDKTEEWGAWFGFCGECRQGIEYHF